MKSKGRSSISGGQSYREVGEFWDSHDLAEYWDETREAEFEVEIESEVTYYALGRTLSEQIQSRARREGVSADSLLNLWVEEKLRQER